MSMLTHSGYWPPAALRLWRPLGGSVAAYLRQWQTLRVLCRPVPGRSARELARQLLQQLEITIDYSAGDVARLLAGEASFLAVAPTGSGLLEALALFHTISEFRPNLCLADEGLLAVLAPVLAGSRLGLPQVAAGSRHLAPLLPLLQNQVPVLWLPAPFSHAAALTAHCLRRGVPVMQATLEPLAGRNRKVPGRPSIVQELAGLPAELLAWQGQHLRIRLEPVLPASPPPAADPVGRRLLETDIAALNAGSLLLRNGHYEVYQARRHRLPHVLPELRRLRGGQSGKTGAEDSSRQLFIYDRAAGRVVGGCRLGPGRVILGEQGKAGFYAHTQVRLPKALRPVLRQSVELSGAFVVPAYQPQRLAMMLLWQAIAIYLARHPRYRYLLGEVQLPRPQARATNEELAAFLQQHYLVAGHAEQALPRKRVRYHAPLGAGSKVAARPSGELLHELAGQMAPAGLPVPAPGRYGVRHHARLLALYTCPQEADRLAGLALLEVAALVGFAHRGELDH